MKSLIQAGALILATALFNIACSTDTVSSKDVNADAINQSYTLSYNEADNSTWMYAQFRVGGSTGTTVDLNDPAQLRINGQTPTKSTFLGTSYEINNSGFVRSATFEFRGSDGKTMVNSINIDPVYLRKADQTVSVAQPYLIDVEAPNLGSNEYVSVRLTQQIQKPDGSIQFNTADGVYLAATNKASFSPSDLNRLSGGVAKLEISRQKSQRLSQSTRDGGGISASYNLRPLSVTIVGK